MKVFDVFSCIKCIPIEIDGPKNSREAPHDSTFKLSGSIYAVVTENSKRLVASELYSALAWRLPVIGWLTGPFLILWLKLCTGNKKRGTPSVYKPKLKAKTLELEPTHGMPASTIAATVTGGIILGSNLIFGALNIKEAWPFACYPTFASLGKNRYDSIEIEMTDSHGMVKRDQAIWLLKEKGISSRRSAGIIQGILKDSHRKDRLQAFLNVLIFKNIVAPDIDSVRFFASKIDVTPEKLGMVLGDKKFIAEYSHSSLEKARSP